MLRLFLIFSLWRSAPLIFCRSLTPSRWIENREELCFWSGWEIAADRASLYWGWVWCEIWSDWPAANCRRSQCPPHQYRWVCCWPPSMTWVYFFPSLFSILSRYLFYRESLSHKPFPQKQWKLRRIFVFCDDKMFQIITPWKKIKNKRETLSKQSNN